MDRIKRKKNRRAGIWRAVLFVIVSFVLGLTVYGWNVKALTGDQMPMPLGFGVGVVRSGSMEPELSVDDLVVVCESDSYKVGDTVVFQERTTLVVHKIVAIEGELAVTQGTANNTPDEPIELSRIKGKVLFHIGWVGKLVDFLSSPLVSIGVLTFAVWLLVRSYRNDGKEASADEKAIRAEIEKLKKESGEDREE